VQICELKDLINITTQFSKRPYLTNVSSSTSADGIIANSPIAWALAVLVYRHVTLPVSTRWHTALAKQCPFQITCVRNHHPPTDDTAMYWIVLSNGVLGNGGRYMFVHVCIRPQQSPGKSSLLHANW